MLWDPDGPARKPPPLCVDLLLSVTEMFDLARTFQSSIEPDFLLMTIGQTTRDAIERAYDWLIPIISSVPSTISRLPSSASCFLLLRAYGTGGDERKLLKQLSAPLLIHVRESLNGKYGEVDSSKAFDLLMSDVASNKPERRRCARRVLQDALEENSTDAGGQSWMLRILKVDFAAALVVDAIKHMVRSNCTFFARYLFVLIFHLVPLFSSQVCCRYVRKR
jgi:integrator complex subunit 1